MCIRDRDWIAPPRPAVSGQVVLVVDDIFDEGDTLQAILNAVHQQGAAAVYSAALVNKRHNRKVPGLTVDFIGLEVPDRYVFGCGMDYQEYWRNLPTIYAVSYTHLDVYKRQLPASEGGPSWNVIVGRWRRCWPALKSSFHAGAEWFNPLSLAITGNRFTPVSYTHLDVYKRQVQH